MKISKAFEVFQKEAPNYQKPYLELVAQLEEVTALDKKNSGFGLSFCIGSDQNGQWH